MTLIGARDNSVLNVFPAGMQNSALVLSDEDGNSVTELEELSSVSEQNVTPAAINIENSTDVIIGPVTQFHGPVTIYQNVNGTPAIGSRPENESANYQNGKLIKSESTSSDAPHTTEKPHKAFLLYSKHLKYLGIALILIMVIVIIASTVILSTNNSGSVTTKNPDTSDYVATTTKPSDTSNHVDDNVTIGPVGPGAILDRKKWGGRDALNFTVPLKHPTPFVIISHTATPFCKNFAECSKRVRSIQEYHVSLKSPDIGYNFLIGGDGNAYVGRGWDIRNFHTANSIGINFIGNYIYDHLTPNMIKIAKFLLEEGLQQGKLSTDYKLIGHNQTFATLSPGTNVYEVIKTWPHFDPETYLPA